MNTIKTSRILLFVIICMGIMISSAFAQTSPLVKDRDFNIQTFQPAPGRGSFLTVEGARVDDHLGYSLGFMFNYQYKALNFLTNTGSYSLIKHHSTIDLLASFSLYEIFEIGIAMPIVVHQSGEDAIQPVGTIVESGIRNSAGVSDMRFHLKLDMLNALENRFDNFGLALITVISAPLGNEINPDDFIGESTVTVQPKLAFETKFWRIRLGLNVGYLWTKDKKFWQSERGHRLTYGLGAEVSLHERVKAFFEMYGNNAFDSNNYNNLLELYGGLKIKLVEGLWTTLGAGGGPGLGTTDSLNKAVGSPVFRAFFGLKWEPPIEVAPVDNDGDGILNDQDRCPNTPEDFDNYRDNDGCPELDNDKDGINDTDDKCPNKAEDKDGFEDEDGCPDLDNDNDGIADENDECPEEKGLAENNGCPVRDRDGDGILDDVDQCPDNKETFNGIDDEDGCPDQAKVKMTKEKIEILDKVFFKSGSSVIQSKSFDLLAQVAQILKDNADIYIQIEGHTDSSGSHSGNVRLSKKRADSVKRLLVTEGVAAERVTTIGFGPDKPIETNKTRVGRAANRRVEFIIVADDSDEDAEDDADDKDDE